MLLREQQSGVFGLILSQLLHSRGKGEKQQEEACFVAAVINVIGSAGLRVSDAALQIVAVICKHHPNNLFSGAGVRLLP